VRDELLDVHKADGADVLLEDFDSQDILDVEDVVFSDFELLGELPGFHDGSEVADALIFFDNFEVGEKILDVHDGLDGAVGELLDDNDGNGYVDDLDDLDDFEERDEPLDVHVGADGTDVAGDAFHSGDVAFSDFRVDDLAKNRRS